MRDIDEEMFDVQRPEDVPTLPKVIKSRGHEREDRPPVASSEEEDMGEVDRPAMCSLVQDSTVGKQQDEGNTTIFGYFY